MSVIFIEPNVENIPQVWQWKVQESRLLDELLYEKHAQFLNGGMGFLKYSI